MKPTTSDFIIIGGGIMGISIARQLKKDIPEAKISVLEKEKECGMHASGRNSGVLHAGFYYPPDSLKAKFTRHGNAELTAYCKARNIALNQCGKLVVAKNAADLVSLDILLQRAHDNGVVVDDISETQAKKLEPRVKTYQRALFSPTTSSVDPQQVMHSLRQDAENEGIHICCDTQYLKKRRNGVIATTQGDYQAGFIINAGGLYADKIANDFHFSKNHRILPFKGLYLYSNEAVNAIKTLIYPVPDLAKPFLGVHFTINAQGQAKLGPTAIPAFWREQYSCWNGFNLKEFGSITCRQLNLLVRAKFDFKKMAIEELKKYSKSYLVHLSSSLVSGIKKENFTHFGVPGIRAQLLNCQEKKLEMDFIIEGDQHSIHVLNAVSPGFTSALPFSRHVCEEIKKRLA